MKRNYQFEKRQKDLAKKKKQEEKLQRRLERANRPAGEETDIDGAPADGSPADLEGGGLPNEQL